MTHLKRILVPTDFSEPSERSAAYAVELARRYEAENETSSCLEAHEGLRRLAAGGLRLGGDEEAV
ncbi:MAG: universal stress protein [Phycisphaerae bacterium]